MNIIFSVTHCDLADDFETVLCLSGSGVIIAIRKEVTEDDGSFPQVFADDFEGISYRRRKEGKERNEAGIWITVEEAHRCVSAPPPRTDLCDSLKFPRFHIVDKTSNVYVLGNEWR